MPDDVTPALSTAVAPDAPAPQPSAPPAITPPKLQMPSAAPANSQMPLPAPPPRSVASRIGRGVLSSLFGPQQQTVVNPDGSTTDVPVPAPTGGRLFRNILAGFLLGGEGGQEAHNANPQSGFGAGVVAGAGAVAQNNRNNYQMQRQQAIDNFNRQQQMKVQQQQMAESKQKMDIEAQENVRADKLFQQNVAVNQQQLLLNSLKIQGETAAQHMQHMELGKAAASVYDAAGVRPEFTNIPGSFADMQKFLQLHPEAAGMEAYVTGIGPHIGADGNIVRTKDGEPDYVETYSFYKRDAKVTPTITSDLLDKMKKVGMPNDVISLLSPGKDGVPKQVPAQDWSAIYNMYLKKLGDYTDQQKQQLALNEGAARIDVSRSEIMKNKAEASKYLQDIATTKDERAQADSFQDALGVLDAAMEKAPKGSDPRDVLKTLPLKAQTNIANGFKTTMEIIDKKLTADVKAMQENPEDPAAKAEVQRDYQQFSWYQGLNPLAASVKPKEGTAAFKPSGDPVVDRYATLLTNNNLDAKQQEQQIEGANIPEAQKQKLRESLGLPALPPPKPSAIGAALSDFGRRVKNVAQGRSNEEQPAPQEQTPPETPPPPITAGQIVIKQGTSPNQ